MEGVRHMTDGVLRVNLVQVPAERGTAGTLAAGQREQLGQRFRRYTGDCALEGERSREERRVRVRELGVLAQSLLERSSSLQDGADLAARGDAEVEGRADALAGQRDAVPGAVAGE